MYAVIATGGKQYRVTPGETLKVEKLSEESGSSITFDVLMVGNGEKTEIGSPTVAGAKVKASIVGEGRGKKINIIKMKRRKHHMKRQGHRQDFTEIRIDAIESKTVKSLETKAPAKKAKAAVAETTAKKAASSKKKPAAKKD